ncbi:hypothetical protein D623_10016199 [Myotis brandtii]|uniref:Uncharacterized protein n=1 Tax=Myotis brandtii TaxID=109478 RepID=S7MRE7_MYOBR|nr:hypothetical protein D623_10016199 [Myotis brandtii]
MVEQSTTQEQLLSCQELLFAEKPYTLRTVYKNNVQILESAYHRHCHLQQTHRTHNSLNCSALPRFVPNDAQPASKSLPPGSLCSPTCAVLSYQLISGGKCSAPVNAAGH